MTVYVIGQIAIHDRETYDRYASGFLPTLAPYGGRLLAADEAPQVLEGEGASAKAVLIAFADAEKAKAWMNGPEYQAIVGDRLAASTGRVLLVQGFPSA